LGCLSNLDISCKSLYRPEEFGELAVLADCLGEGLLGGVIHQTAPVMKQKHVADLTGVVLCKDVLDCYEVFERFRHLLAMDMEVSGMPEVVDPVVAVVVGLALGKFVIVVRETEVNAA
jgi:hypothetical protein